MFTLSPTLFYSPSGMLNTSPLFNTSPLLMHGVGQHIPRSPRMDGAAQQLPVAPAPPPAANGSFFADDMCNVCELCKESHAESELCPTGIMSYGGLTPAHPPGSGLPLPPARGIRSAGTPDGLIDGLNSVHVSPTNVDSILARYQNRARPGPYAPPTGLGGYPLVQVKVEPDMSGMSASGSTPGVSMVQLGMGYHQRPAPGRSGKADRSVTRSPSPDGPIPSDPAQAKKLYHVRAEKKRRAKENDLVRELHFVLPNSTKMPVHKPVVLRTAIEYIQQLQEAQNAPSASLDAHTAELLGEIARLKRENMLLTEALHQRNRS